MTRLLIFFLIGYPLWLTTAYFVQRRVVFPRHYTEPMENAGEGIEGLEKIWLDTEEGKVEAWFMPGDGVSAAHPGPLLFYAHGNGELIDYWPAALQPYRRMGVSVALVEFRGYGRSAGSPSQAGITRDCVQAYDLLARRPEVDITRVVYHGRSVGTGIACSLAKERPPAAMILQSPFTAVSDMMLRYGIPPFLCADPMNNKAVVKEFGGPILMLHGRFDKIIPPTHSRALIKLAKNGKLIEYECGHNNFPVDSKEFWGDVESFLRSCKVLKSD